MAPARRRAGELATHQPATDNAKIDDVSFHDLFPCSSIGSAVTRYYKMVFRILPEIPFIRT
jgi:hypothetical protein